MSESDRLSFIDAHCHLNAREFDKDLDLVIANAKQTGVEGAVVVTESVHDFKRTLELAKCYKGWIYPCLGVHPVQGINSVTRADLDEALPVIEQHRDDIVAIGEIGLDFSPWICQSNEDKLIQEEVFRKQLRLAKSLDLPVNIHSRSAAKRVLEILTEEGAQKVLLHNFAGRPSVALQAAKRGFYMSFPPIVTTKPERNKLLRSIPLSNLCLETDSPALAIYAKERNEPCKITKVCKHLAEIMDIPIAEVAENATRNTKLLFSLA